MREILPGHFLRLPWTADQSLSRQRNRLTLAPPHCKRSVPTEAHPVVGSSASEHLLPRHETPSSLRPAGYASPLHNGWLGSFADCVLLDKGGTSLVVSVIVRVTSARCLRCWTAASPVGLSGFDGSTRSR
jgi:hypothetical protein